MSTLTEFRATFGSGHSGPLHPRWTGASHHGWLRIDAADERLAREVLAHALGGAYSCIYHPDDDGYPDFGQPGDGDPDYYPDGQTGHLHAFRGPVEEAMWRWIRTSVGVWEGPAPDEVHTELPGLADSELEALAAEMPSRHLDGSLTPLYTYRYDPSAMRPGVYAGWQIERAGYMDDARHLGIVYLNRTGVFHCYGRTWVPGDDQTATIGGGATALGALTAYAPVAESAPAPRPEPGTARHPLPWSVQLSRGIPLVVDGNGAEIDLADATIAAAICTAVNAHGAQAARVAELETR